MPINSRRKCHKFVLSVQYMLPHITCPLSVDLNLQELQKNLNGVPFLLFFICESNLLPLLHHFQIFTCHNSDHYFYLFQFQAFTFFLLFYNYSIVFLINRKDYSYKTVFIVFVKRNCCTAIQKYYLQ